MNNIILLVVEMICAFGGVLLFKKMFGKIGVVAWVVIATLLANIITAKTVDMFGLSVALGTVLFASVYLATDILSEYYDKETAQKAVKLGLLSNVVMIVFSQLALRYIPNSFDYAHSSMEVLFGLNLRISIASMIMYYIANMLDISLFEKIRNKTNGKMLWVRNNVSTILCNCLENFFFIFLAFYGIYNIKTVLVIAASTSVIEIIVAICDTPFLYLAKK